MGIFEQQQQAERDRQRNLTNAATNTGAFAKFQSTGQGAFQFEEYIDFAVAYVEEPFMSYGAYIDASDLRDLLDIDDDDVTPPYPQATGFVTEWHLDADGYYVGAYVGVRVSFPSDIPVATDVAVVISHYYRFEGMALRGV